MLIVMFAGPIKNTIFEIYLIKSILIFWMLLIVYKRRVISRKQIPNSLPKIHSYQKLKAS